MMRKVQKRGKTVRGRCFARGSWPLTYVRGSGNAGFTLIEILVAAGIASIIFGVGYYAVATTITTSNATTQRVRDTENARLFFQMLERDLASASPGPGNMVKDRANLAPTPPPANHSPIVLTEVVNGTAATNDILNFYCRADHTGVRDEVTFVRYYVNRNDVAHTLCRQTVPYDSNVVGPTPDVDYTTLNPSDYTNAANNNEALFDNVRQLSVVFQKWDVTNKKTVKEPAVAPAQCDSILVTVVFTNEFGYRSARLDNPSLNKDADDYKEKLSNTYRSFSKVLALPASFKQ